MAEDCLKKNKKTKLSLGHKALPKLSSAPMPCDAEATAADTHSVPAATSAAPGASGGIQLVLDQIPKSTGGAE